MSFYWQQALQEKQSTDQQGAAQQQQQQQGQWDYINLGGAPAQEYQWNGQPQQAADNSNYHQYYQNAQTYNRENTTQHANAQYQEQQHHQQQQQQQRVNQVPAQTSQATAHVEHTPILPQPQVPPQQQQPQQHQNYPPIATSVPVQSQPVQSVAPVQHVQPVQAFQQQSHHVQPTAPPLPTSSFQHAPLPQSAPVAPIQQYQAPPSHQQTVHVQPKEQSFSQQHHQVTPSQHFQPASHVPVSHYEQQWTAPVAQVPPSKEPTPESIPTPIPQFVAPIVAQSFEPPPPQSIPIPSFVAPTPVSVSNTEELLSVDALQLQPAAVQSEEVKIKTTPTSSEDDWERADIEVQAVENETRKKQQERDQLGEPSAMTEPQESRESSLGGSWSQNEDSERNSVDQQEERPVRASNWEHEVAVQPIPARPVVEEKPAPVAPKVKKPAKVVQSQQVQHQHTEFRPEPESDERTQVTPEVKDLSSHLSSPGEAQATSTPKNEMKLEKRSSVSSQKTIEPEEPRAPKAPNLRRESAPSNVIDEQRDGSGNNSDSTVASAQPEMERGSIRASYRNYKQQYSEILKRLNGYRSDKNRADFRPSSKLANPLLAAAGVVGNAIRSETMHNLGARNDGRASVPLHHSQSFNDDLGAGARRQRVSRLEGGRPSSRQSGYNVPVNQSFGGHDPRMRMHPQQGYQGRYSSMGVPYSNQYGDYDQRRPQSAYMMEQQYATAGYAEPQDGSSLSETDEEDDADSEDEIRGYTQQNASYQGGPSRHQQYQTDGKELYYFGVVHLDRETIARIMDRYPPAPQYYALPAIEKAAFMFYAAVYKQQYRNVDAFHKLFNREFFKYQCAGDNDDTALFKICKSMQDQYHARMQEKNQRAYEASQKHLFSDDNSVDAQSEITSLYGNEEDSIASMDVFNKGPLKFLCPHSFMSFGVGGKTVSVRPDQSISVVFIDDIKRYLSDVPTVRVLDTAQTFKGPLIPNLSQPHTVRLYISKQIEAIKNCEVARENPNDNDVVESLLVWQLLETMVKQQGNITGPDIAELLAKVANKSPVVQEVYAANADIGAAVNKYTEFLLGGHVDEAIETATRNGLFADAMVLTRRLYPGDEKKIAEIEERFLETRSFDNPVTTLASVASGMAPPVLTNPPLDDHMSWRTHAAIILANLDQKETAMNTIYHLGRALAKRDYHCAADFCFLVVCVLAGYNPFMPIQATEGEEDVRRHISLVNSGIPDDDYDSVRCQYGFTVTDLHATEIFDYALRLKPERGESPLASSVEYQTARMKYAKLLSSHGFTTDAYRYCVEIVRCIWHHYEKFDQNDILEMCELADRLQYAASATQAEIDWFEQLRQMSSALKSPQHAPALIETANVEQELPREEPQYQPQPEPVQHQPKSETVKYEDPQKHEQESLSQEAQNWHDGHQEPIEMTMSSHQLKQEAETPISQTGFEYPQVNAVQPLEHPPKQEEPEPVAEPPVPMQSYVPQTAQSEMDFWNQSHSQPQNIAPVVQAAPLQAPIPAPVPEHRPEPEHYPVMPSAPTPIPQIPQQSIVAPQPPVQQAPVQTHAPPTQQNQTPPVNAVHPRSEELKDLGKASGDMKGSKGWLGSLRDKVAKSIPGQNQMILPDDSKQTIRWDPVAKKYIGEGVEEDVVAAPPPTIQSAPVAQVPAQQNNLRSARVSGASRYFQPTTMTGDAASIPTAMAPPMPLPVSFGFMPAPVDDGEYVDPFSGQADPSIHQPKPQPRSDE